MKNKTLLSVFITIVFLVLAATGIKAALTGLPFSGSGLDDSNQFNSSYNWNQIDNYKIESKDIVYDPISEYSTDYTDNNIRYRINQDGKAHSAGAVATASGFIISNQYGDFFIDTPITLSTGGDNSDCDLGGTAYKMAGTLKSPEWGITLKIDDGTSIYCSANQQIILNLDSDDLHNSSSDNEIKDWAITKVGTTDVVVYTTDDGVGGTLAVADVLNSNKISINGLVANLTGSGVSATTGELEFTYSDSATNKKYVAVDYDTSANRSELRQIVDKNIVQMANEFNEITVDSTTKISKSTLNNNTLSYFKSTTNTNSFNLEDNKGEIIEIGDGVNTINTNKALEIDGEHTIIVEGANIYIKSNIYNTNSSSILTLIVKRDSSDKFGGNIYIDPEVTNIDAVLIADGSILSYFNNNIYSSSDSGDVDTLSRQLMIYGSIATSNTIGDDNAPYGSDKYIKAGGESVEDKIYNLEYLRAFEPKFADATSASGVCNEAGTEGDVISFTERQYEFAGKRECNLGDLGQELDGGPQRLRTTGKLSPLVIEYNPLLQTNPPKILQK